MIVESQAAVPTETPLAAELWLRLEAAALALAFHFHWPEPGIPSSLIRPCGDELGEWISQHAAHEVERLCPVPRRALFLRSFHSFHKSS